MPIGSGDGLSAGSGDGAAFSNVGVLTAGTVSSDVPTSKFIAAPTIVELASIIPAVKPQYAIPWTLTGTVTVTPAMSYQLGLLLAERCQVTAAEAEALIAKMSATELMRLSDLLAVARPAALSETVTLTLLGSTALSLTGLEQLGIREVLSQVAVMATSAAEKVALTDALAKFIGMALQDTLTLSSTWTVGTARLALLAGPATITAAVSPHLLIQMTAAEELDVTDTMALQALYAPVVTDGVVFEISYLSPGSGVNTWVMNTRTGAVTEYSNFNFNSYAKLGTRYLAAAPEGLYELTGSDDQGTAIAAEVAGGFLQFGGTQLSRLKAAYLGMRGAGQFYLKIETGDGVTYTYGVETRSMRSTKVHMGKGQRSRYFAYPLTSVGSDFDLDSIEFVPLAVERRV